MIRELIELVRGEIDGFSFMLSLCSMIFVVFCTLPIHEYAHARVAVWLGDDTPRLTGRLTVNPMAHIHPIGALMLFLVGFGYAKPVEVNMRNFKNPKLGMAITALAGPVSNLIMAFIFFLLGSFCAYGYNSSGAVVLSAIYTFLFYAGTINISLAVFNLIPIPPLDGSRLLTLLVPSKYYYKLMQYERYIMIALFVLLFTGALSTPLMYLTTIVTKGLVVVTNAIAGVFF